MIVRKFNRSDLANLDGRLQPWQINLQSKLAEKEYADSIEQGDAWTAEQDGVVLCCGGFVELWPGRAMAWSLISAEAGEYMWNITKAVRELLAGSKFRRVEAYVEWGFTPGHRWARLLGFQLEGIMKKFAPHGADMVMYARVK